LHRGTTDRPNTLYHPGRRTGPFDIDPAHFYMTPSLDRFEQGSFMRGNELGKEAIRVSSDAEGCWPQL